MEKEYYETPMIRIIEVKTENVVCLSGGGYPSIGGDEDDWSV